MSISTEKCTLCGNRCKVTSLKCKRGINHYARLEKEQKENAMMESNQKKDGHIETSNDTNSLKEDTHHTEDELTSLLIKTSHIFHHKKGHKRGQGKILKILSKRGEMNQKELQDILQIESGTMSEFVIKLEQKGFITRTKDEADKRQTKLAITQDGLHKVNENELRSKDKFDTSKLYEALTKEEREQLKVLLKKLHSGNEQ